MITTQLTSEEVEALGGVISHPGFKLLEEILETEEALCREKLLTDDGFLYLWRAFVYIKRMLFVNPAGIVNQYLADKNELKLTE